MEMFIIKLVFTSALIGGITWLLAGYQGLSWTAVVVLVVAIIYHFITTQTVLGRHIYAVGGKKRPDTTSAGSWTENWFARLTRFSPH